MPSSSAAMSGKYVPTYIYRDTANASIPLKSAQPAGPSKVRTDLSTVDDVRSIRKKKIGAFYASSLFKFGIAPLLAVSVCAAIFVPLGVNLNSNTYTTTSPTTLPTTSTSFLWNSTGTIVAGISNSSGTSANQLNQPYGLALDSSNSLYITDRQNNRVQKYLSGALTGTTVAGLSNGTAGIAMTQLNQPGYLTVDSNSSVYVTDSNNNRVQFWANGASSGSTIAGTGINGSALNQFDAPRGIARDASSGTLYIADQYNHRILSYVLGTVTGSVVAGGNGCGLGSTQLCEPIGVLFDSSSNSLFIVNHGVHTVVRWTLGATNWSLVAGIINSAGPLSTQLSYPSGITLDSMGNLYVADTSNSRIQFFIKGQTNGTTIAGTTGVAGNSLSLLSSPYWVSLDTQLNLYVADRDNNRVLKFLHY